MLLGVGNPFLLAIITTKRVKIFDLATNENFQNKDVFIENVFLFTVLLPFMLDHLQPLISLLCHSLLVMISFNLVLYLNLHKIRMDILLFQIFILLLLLLLPALRRSSRQVHSSTWMHHFIIPNSTTFHASSFHLYNCSVDSSHQAFFNNLLSIKEPTSYSQAKLDPL